MDTSKPIHPTLSQAFSLLFTLMGFALAIGLPIAVLRTLLPQPLKEGGLLDSVLHLVMYGVPLVLTVRVGLRRMHEVRAPLAVLRFSKVPAGILMMVCLLTLPMGFITEPLTRLLPTPGWFEQAMAEAVRPNAFSFISLVILAPLLEEALFRGVILGGLLKRYNPSKAIAWSSVLFGLAHLNPWQGVECIVAGLFLGWVYWKTRSLTPCILIHAIHNLAWFVLAQYTDPATSFVSLLGGKLYIPLFLGAAALFGMGLWWLARKLVRVTPAYAR